MSRRANDCTPVSGVLGPCFMTITKDEGGSVSSRITLAVKSCALGAQAPRRNGLRRSSSVLDQIRGPPLPGRLTLLVFLDQLGLCVKLADPSCLTAPSSVKAASRLLALRPEPLRAHCL
jgi:hypothetical protein